MIAPRSEEVERGEELREPKCAAWDLDSGVLPDGTTIDRALEVFRGWVGAWSATCSGDASSAWRCPAAWRGAAASDWIVRGARLTALGRAIIALPSGSLATATTHDPVLARLARGMARANRRTGVSLRITCSCSVGHRFASRLEPVSMAAWWYLTAIARIAWRVSYAPSSSLDVLHLEPLVAGTPDPVRHNWGAVDPVGAGAHAVRIQVPVGFGASVRRMRTSMRSIAGAVLPEDLAWPRSLLAVLLEPLEAKRRWPRGADCAGINLVGWSRAMRRRLCFSTTLQAAAFVDAAVSSLPPAVRHVHHASCWFEHQPQERAFVQRVRLRFPGTRVTGHMLYHFSRCSHGGIVPTRLEVSQGAVPDSVRCCGSMQRDWLRSECPWVSFEVAPSGRFSIPYAVRDPSCRVALVVVPSSDAAAVAMIRMVADAIKSIPAEWSIRVRLHPASGELPRAATHSAGLSIDQAGSFGESLECAGIVLGGASSAIVVARSSGWPVVVLAPPGLPGMDPFPPAHRLEGVAVAATPSMLASCLASTAATCPYLDRVPALFS